MVRPARKSEAMDDQNTPTTPTKRARRKSIPKSEPRAGRMSLRHTRNGSMSTAPSRSRRNTVGSSITRTSKALDMKTQAPGWPEHKVPVEIYAEIISYLPRSAVKNMRLVNQEFERKTSSIFFQVVVVPFNSEIYGITPEPRFGSSQPLWEEEMPESSILLQDKGMRVFQGFGEHIKKFAMSFEFNEAKLAKPPTKDDQQAITSFWGIYPWPYTNYNRFAHLEGLEQTADETKTMAKALEYITSANELGLSLDGCLGYLNGPDINSRCAARCVKSSVFGTPKYVAEPISQQEEVDGLAASRPVVMSAFERRGNELRRMCVAAGWTGAQLELAIESIRANDHVKPEEVDDNSTTPTSKDAYRANSNLRNHPLDANLLQDLVTNNSSEGVLAFTEVPSSIISEDVAQREERARQVYVRLQKKLDLQTLLHALNPKILTQGQREMLLEIEWAQRAFMQSYVIAIIDKQDIFRNVTKFTIARVPFRHLHVIRRDDFWESLPSLATLSLAIIPDWRDVVKEPTGNVEDVKLMPSMAVLGVYQLFLDQVGGRENIKSLHFEWICGGEYAPGMYSRNQHILPAPIVAKASNMVDRSPAHVLSVLRFPYLKSISLKNCWASPHVLKKFLSGLRNDGVEIIKLDSVSLTANVPFGTCPGPLSTTQAVGQQFGNVAGVAAPNFAANWIQPVVMQAPPVPLNILQPVPQNIPAPQVLVNPTHQNAQGLNPTAPAFQPAQVQTPQPNLQSLPSVGQGTAVTTTYTLAAQDSDWLQTPRENSWACIINSCTPGQTIQDYRWRHSLGGQPPRRLRHSLQQLVFTSCGYAVIPAEFTQTAVQEVEPTNGLPSLLQTRYKEIERGMMEPGDYLLAKIANHIDGQESLTLQNIFGLTVNWMSRDQARMELLSDCALDGVPRAGLGRFDGIISRI